MQITHGSFEMTEHAPYGWVWLDDDGWEHDPDPTHPQERGEAEYGTEFRPATKAEAISDEYYRAPKVFVSLQETNLNEKE